MKPQCQRRFRRNELGFAKQKVLEMVMRMLFLFLFCQIDFCWKWWGDAKEWLDRSGYHCKESFLCMCEIRS